jgi:hypothetical protein
MRIFDDGIMPVDFDKGTLLKHLQQAEDEQRSDRLLGILVLAVAVAIFVAAMTLKYWMYVPGVRA